MLMRWEPLPRWTPRLQAALYTGQVFVPLLRVAGVAADTLVAAEAVVVAGIAVEGPSDAETLLVAVVMKKSADLRIVD